MLKFSERLDEGRTMTDIAMCELLSQCWLSTIDPGPYNFEVNQKPNFHNQVLKSDIPMLLLTFRVGSFKNGSTYNFNLRCPECRSKVPWTTDLEKYILPRTRPLSEEGIQYLADKTPIDIDFTNAPDEVEFRGERVSNVGIRLLTLHSEKQVDDHLKQEIRRKERRTKNKTGADSLASYLLTVNGQPLKNVAEKLKFMRDLTHDSLLFFRDSVDEHEAELDANVTARCHECKWEFDTILPFGPSFLDPSSSTRRERLFGLPGEETPREPSDSQDEQTS